MKECSHLDQIKEVTPNSEGCAECIALGDTWVHLRMCRTCGHVGCCEDSKNQHAMRHFHETGHPIIKSFEPNEEWSWCYIDEAVVELETAPPPERVEDSERSAAIIRNYLIIAGLYTLSASVIWGGQTQSIPFSYVVAGLTTALTLPAIVALRRLGQPADIIIGTAGKKGTCAAQGLPSVSAVDTTTHVVTATEA